MVHPHFTQIDIKRKVAERIAQIEVELAQLRGSGVLRVRIDAITLFYLEALGYMVDFTTGEVCAEDLSAKNIPF